MTATKTIDPTASVLAGMLTENTGTHMLDSGGAYGRAWQRNQGQTIETLEAAPLVHLDFWDGELEGITIDVFQFLKECLEYDEDLDAKFQAYAETQPDEGWMTICDDFMGELKDVGELVSGLYGDGDPWWTNTYNSEDALSQTLQYLFFTLDDEEFVLLQIHGGADVRGGYTTPRVFGHSDGGAWSIHDNARVSAVTHYEESDAPKLFPVEPVHPRWWTSENAGYSFENSENYGDKLDADDWVVKDDKVFYKPWGTEVIFLVP